MIMRRQWMALISVASLSLIVGCSGSSFQGISGQESADDKPSSDGGVELGGEEEGEEIPIDHPAMVTGSFLTCVAEGSDVALCKIEDENGKIDISQVDVEWKVIDAFNIDLKKTFFPQDPGAEWHIKAVVGKTDLARSRMTAEVTKSGYTRHLEAIVRVQEEVVINIQDFLDSLKFGGSIGGDDPQDGNDPETVEPTSKNPGIKEFGIDEDYRVGDGSFVPSANEDCSDLVMQTVNLSGRMVSFPIEVANDGTQIGIILGDVCGAVSPRSNIAQVVDAAGKVVSTKGVWSGRNNHTVSLPGFTANAGKYELQIISNKKNASDYDDYVVGSVRVIVDGPIQIGEPNTK